MKVATVSPARTFTVKGVTMEHVADIELAADELVTFKTQEGAEYDVTAKDWGYYATPSTNGRLRDFGYKTAVARSAATGRIYVLLVERDKLSAFEDYCREQQLTVQVWLDEDG